MRTIIRKAMINSVMGAILAACLPENRTVSVSPTNSLATFSQKVALISAWDGHDEICMMNSSGSGQTNLSNRPASEWFPCWSADSKQIAFSSDRDGASFFHALGHLARMQRC